MAAKTRKNRKSGSAVPTILFAIAFCDGGWKTNFIFDR
jgi:hypothetical protein